MSKKQLHVCVLTSAHLPGDVRVRHKIVSAFLSAGFKVSWVGPRPAGDQSASKDGSVDSIKYHLVRTNDSKLKRFYAVSALKRAVKEVSDVDVYFAPDPDSAMLANELAKTNGARVIFDIHEVYHGPMLERWLGMFAFSFIREFVRRRIALTAIRSDLVVAVNQPVLDMYSSEPMPRLVLRNCSPKWFAGESLDWSGSKKNPHNENFVLMHGKDHPDRGSAVVFSAVEMASKTVPNLRVITFGPPSLQNGSEQIGTQALIERKAPVSLTEMPNVLQSCDVGLIGYGRNLGQDSLPNRLFEYMAAGLPVIAPIYATEMRRIIESEQCGLLVDFENPEEVAAAIHQLYANPEMRRRMGQRAKEAFLLRHNSESEALPLMNIVKGWFDKRPASRAA